MDFAKLFFSIFTQRSDGDVGIYGG